MPENGLVLCLSGVNAFFQEKGAWCDLIWEQEQGQLA